MTLPVERRQCVTCKKRKWPSAFRSRTAKCRTCADFGVRLGSLRGRVTTLEKSYRRAKRELAETEAKWTDYLTSEAA